MDKHPHLSAEPLTDLQRQHLKDVEDQLRSEMQRLKQTDRPRRKQRRPEKPVLNDKQLSQRGARARYKRRKPVRQMIKVRRVTNSKGFGAPSCNTLNCLGTEDVRSISVTLPSVTIELQMCKRCQGILLEKLGHYSKEGCA